MKKAGIIILLSVCALGLFFFSQGKQEKRVEAADCLPANVLFYGEQLEFTDMYQTFLNSRLGRILNRMDYTGIAAELGGFGESIAEAEKVWRKVMKVMDSREFNELLGKEFSVALFPADSFSTENPAKAIEERLLLIARPRHNAKMLQFLIPLLSQDVEQSTVQYGSHTISRYRIDEDNTLSIATIQGLVLAGLEERLVRKSLDYYDNKKDTLSESVNFKRLRKSFKDTKLFTYLSLPALVSQGRVIGKTLPEEDREEFFALLDQWNGWGETAYGAWHEKGLVKDKAVILFDQSRLDSRVARLCDVKPGDNKTLKVLPSDTFFYYWTNTLNLPLMWELYSSSATQQQPEALDILRHELRDSAGVELEELLNMIGNEFALIVEDVDRQGIPLPKVIAVVQLRKPEKFLEVFNILLQNADIPASLNQYQGQNITYWGVAPQGGLQPAFTVIDEYLYISNSTNFVKQIVDLQTDSSKNLLNNEAMKEVVGDLLKKNNSATYIHIAKLADSLKELATWAGAMAVLQGPEAEKKSSIVINRIVIPFLDGVAMYTQLGSRSVITEDSIVLESTTTIVQ